VGGNVRVVSDAATRVTSEVAAESVQAGVELLEHDGLSLDLADLLCNDALSHLLKDEEALLDDFNTLGVANYLLFFFNSDRAFAEFAVVEVAGAVEVVEAIHRAESTIVVKGSGSTNNQFRGREGSGSDAGRESGKSDNESGSEFSEHDDDLNVVERNKNSSLL